MNEIHKTYKYRIYPNKKQRALLQKHFDACRFVWNHFLAERKRSYLEDKKSLTYYDNTRALTKLRQSDEFCWLRDVSSVALQASLQDLDFAYGKFFKKIAKFPKFKSRKSAKKSYRCRQNTYVDDKAIRFPFFKEGIKAKIHTPCEGKIVYVTISLDNTGKYYAAVLCKLEHTPIPLRRRGKMIGIDLGIKTLITCSDGVKIPNIKVTKQLEKKLAYEQRQLSKKQKGSNARAKQKKRATLVHERTRGIRNDYIHKATAKLVTENAIIAAESLNVKGLIKNHKLSKLIADASWARIISQLKYKSEWNNRDFIQVDRFFPSSKMCYSCSFINQNLSLRDRQWTCPECGASHDRDLNASKNILKQGLKVLSVSATESDTKQKRVKASGFKQSLRHPESRT